MSNVKINSLELENVKRVKAVKLEPSENGLTVIGGNNGEGKTSVLDAIAWTLGGDKLKPSTPKREGSMVDPYLSVTLSNGLKVERKGKNSSLKITDPSGKAGGQRLLDSFVNQFALNLPKFMESTSKEKSEILLQIIGIGDELKALDKEYKEKFEERLATGRIAKQKKGHADDMVQWDGVPAEIVSASELIKQQQAILAKNGENQRKREHLEELKFSLKNTQSDYDRVSQQIADLQAEKDELLNKINNLSKDIATGEKSVSQLKDESTQELEESIADIDSINAKVRDNLAKEAAVTEAEAYNQQYDQLTEQLENIKKERIKLFNGAKLPLEGLSVDEEGELIFKGMRWDNMSGSEQLIVATSIVKELNPNCGFVLLDKTEQMDLKTLANFGKWAEDQNLQIIATRVSTGDECEIIIEDGYSVKDGKKTAETEIKPAEAFVEKTTWEF